MTLTTYKIKNEMIYMVNKMVQGPSEKEALKIYEIEKTMALTVFKKYYPDAVIDFKVAEVIEAPIVEELTSELTDKIRAKEKADAELIVKEAEAKAIKKAELEAQLKALDES